MTGSLADGVGNAFSDLDLYLISDRDLSVHQVGPAIILELGLSAIDLEVVRPARVRAASNAVSQLRGRDPREIFTVSRSDLDLLHRLSVGACLSGLAVFEPLHAAIDTAAICDALITEASAELPLQQMDLLGALDENDGPTASCLCASLIGFAVQAVLAALGETNPSAKWRWRKLRQRLATLDSLNLPGGLVGSTLEGLLHSIAFSGDLSETDVRARAHHAVRVGNALVSWAQYHRSGRSLPSTSAEFGAAVASGARSPLLPLDLVVRLDGDCLTARRMFGEAQVGLNAIAWDALLQFDGAVSLSAVSRRLVARHGGTPQAQGDATDDLAASLTHLGFEAGDHSAAGLLRFSQAIHAR
jgi:hypothetical protein